MSLLTESAIFDLIAIITTIVFGVIAFFKWKLTYWDKSGLPTLPTSFPFGNTKDVLLGNITMGEAFRNLYRQFKSKGHKHAGIYFGISPFYLVIDPELIKNIMQKDFQHFVNHSGYVDDEGDPLTAHLFNLKDQKWKNLRVKLTPTFTSGKIKMMFQTLVDCTHGLNDIMNKSASTHSPVDIKDILGRFTTDIIGSTAFGLECNTLKDPDAPFRKYGKMVFEIDFIDRLKFVLQLLVPHSILRACRLKITKQAVENFFMKIVKDTVNYREKNNIYRKDFMHLLLQLKNRGTVSDDEKITSDGKAETKGLTINELAAQVFVFFLAGFETSSTTMTFALYHLARNQDIQQKLRKEINTVLEKYDGKLTYDGMMEMHYMDKVINETLRLQPPFPLLTRECTQDYKIPNTSITLKKGVDVAIPVLALHTDPEYYENPDKFDPERFTEEAIASRKPFTWLPFGDGPRICIGLRFGMLQSKVGLTALLKNYNVTLSSKTELPLKLDKNSFITTADGGIWLDVEKLH